MFGSTLIASLLLVAGTALASDGGAGAPLEGVWVPGQLLQALQADAPQEIPCYVVIETRPLGVLEECGGARTRWSGPVLEEPRAGRLEVSAGQARRLVFRAGTPNELELQRDEGGESEFERLYRLPVPLEERLRSWAAAQRMLVGSWRTTEGTEVEFRADGTYRLATEEGHFRLLPGAPVRGAWAVLALQPPEGAERVYLLVGAGRSVGLAQPPDELLPLLERQLHAPPAQEPGILPGQERGLPVAGEGSRESGVVPEGPGGQEQGVRPMAPPAGQEEGPRPEPPAAEEGEGAAPEPPAGPSPGAEVAGAGGTAPEGLPGTAALEVTILLERTGPGVEQQSAAEVPPEEPAPEPAAPAEPPPIAQPIEPQRRCGCSASEGIGLGLALLTLASGGRKRQPREH